MTTTELPRTPSPPPSPTADRTAALRATMAARLARALRQDHYWLERPISPAGNDSVARSYPYASRLDGTYPIHHGVEFINPAGTPILATARGTIVVAGDDRTEVHGARTDFYGLLVIQELDQAFQGQPLYVLYGHLSEILVQVGQRVETGEVIGLVGMSGVAEGPHLHMEVRYGENDYGATANPELWLRPHENHGALAGLVLSIDGLPVPEARITLYRASDPDSPVRQITSYPNKEVNPDPSWCENFVAGDLEAGQWRVKVYRKRSLHTSGVTIEPGATTWLTVTVPG